jgi:hypothetical protein
LIGSFYEQELQRVSEPDVKEIDRSLSSLQRRKRAGFRGDRDLDYYTSVKGYPNYYEHNELM